MKNEIRELNEMELDGIAAGRVIYACTSNPVIGTTGKKCYEVYSCEGEVDGDYKQFFSNKSASDLKLSFNINYGRVFADKYDAYRKFHADDQIIEF